jgi:hypothetical protein
MADKIKIIKDTMESYPEAGAGNCLKAIRYDYTNMEFIFFDEEEEKSHKVDMPMLEKGLDIFVKIVEDGKYFNCGRAPNLLSKGYVLDGQDADALVQCAIFGDIIYG